MGGPRIDYTSRAKKVRHMKEQRRLWVEYGKPELKKFNTKLKIVAGNKRYTLDALKKLTPDNRKKILVKSKKKYSCRSYPKKEETNNCSISSC